MRYHHLANMLRRGQGGEGACDLGQRYGFAWKERQRVIVYPSDNLLQVAAKRALRRVKINRNKGAALAK